jgi:hypothetical protein
MLRATGKILLLTALVFGGSAGIWYYQDQFAAARKIKQLEVEKKALEQVVKRLNDESRVAEILVTEQKPDPATGALMTTLLFVEYTKGDQSLPPKSFTVEGKHAHVDAMVIKFEHDFVTKGDPLRGHSIALFTRIYGDKQPPANAWQIDRSGDVPEIYRDADPRITEFEQNLWRDFWRLAEDESYRKEKGVRVATGQGVWGMFEPGKLYRITLETDGGLNLTSTKIPGIYKEALKIH